MLGPVFNQGIMLDAQITPGKHSITVSAPADGRYAPVMASYVLNVTLATTNMDLHLPVIGLIPGSIQLSGKLYSSAGPLANAAVVITGGTTIKKVTTAADGTFSTKIGIGMGLSLLGTQGITVQVQPQEPWNAPLTSTKNIFLINYVTLVLILIVLVASRSTCRGDLKSGLLFSRGREPDCRDWRCRHRRQYTQTNELTFL